MNFDIKLFWQNKQLRAFVFSIIAFVIGLILKQFNEYAGNALFCLSFMIGGYYKAKEGVEEFIEKKSFNVDLLMVIAAVGSSVIGFWEEGAILILIFSLSGALEEFTTAKSTQALESLLKLVPQFALLKKGETFEEVKVDTLQIGDVVLVRSGERIPVDGVIIEGTTNIDQSTITGESIPVFKKENAQVFTGTLNITQSILVKNTTTRENTAVERVVKLIEEAETKKSKQEQFVERFEKIYVNVVLISSLLVFLFFMFIMPLGFQLAFYRTMVFLVVASPCAVVAATMPVTLSAISNGAKKGILFKGGETIEKVGDINFLAFDKTGTITEGEPKVVGVYFSEDKQNILPITAALEAKSTHPLAQAIQIYFKEKGITPAVVASVEDIPGFGVQSVVDGITYKVGSKRFLESFTEDKQMEEHENQWLTEAKTLVYVGANNAIVGLIALQDKVRDTAFQTLQEIKSLGIERMMLTGDNKAIAAQIAQTVGISHYEAECLPETKVRVIEENKAKGKYTAMVGDGINDGPALAIADVGIAMGGGSDLASEAANMVLMKNDLSMIPYAYKLSKKHNVVVKQNIFFALLVIITLVISNLVKGIELPYAVVFHEGSTILVILNGLRLLQPLK